MSTFSHFNKEGRPKMVNVANKQETTRSAIARSSIIFSVDLYDAIHHGKLTKGDPLQTAQVAGIMAAKKTWELIPMCHPLLLQGIDLSFEYIELECSYELKITAEVKCLGNTGVEMEALTAVSVAALTFYDMCKAIDKSMIIKETYLVQKKGGKNGDYHYMP
jgi:cyclic pyranopterin monophosphate synthase